MNAFCTSGSVCGIDVITKGSLLDEDVLLIRAFKGFCGYEAAVALELPGEGRTSNCAESRICVQFSLSSNFAC